MARAGQAMAVLALALFASVAFAARAAQIAVPDMTISVLESDGSASTTLDVAQGARATKRLRLDHTQTLKVCGDPTLHLRGSWLQLVIEQA